MKNLLVLLILSLISNSYAGNRSSCIKDIRYKKEKETLKMKDIKSCDRYFDADIILSVASGEGKVKLVLSLLKEGIKDKSGHALEMSIRMKDHKTFDYLLKTYEYSVKDLSEALSKAFKTNDLYIVDALLENGASPHYDWHDGFIEAAKVGNVSMFKKIMEYSLPTNFWDWQTALAVASEHGNIEIVKILLDANSRSEHPETIRTDVVLIASENKHAEIVSLLSDKSNIGFWTKIKIRLNLMGY